MFASIYINAIDILGALVSYLKEGIIQIHREDGAEHKWETEKKESVRKKVHNNVSTQNNVSKSARFCSQTKKEIT